MKLFTLAFLLISFQVAFSQSGSGAIRGTVKDIGKNPVSNAEIKLYLSENLVSETTSNENGLFRIDNVKPGVYTVVIEGSSKEFVTYRNYEVRVSADRITFLDNVTLLRPGEDPKKE